MKKTKQIKLEINSQFAKALDAMENTGQNLFLTGKAGTGKSTLLNHFRQSTKKKIVVLAPTGVAAINVHGQTIHSFFGFKPDITLQKVKKVQGASKGADMFKKLDAIIIDEISMVRADLLDCIDKFMRLNGRSKHLPFGGVQMILIGDLYQIPPVLPARDREIFSREYKTPFFFGAKVFQRPDFDLQYIELEKIYRQKDGGFISLLNSIRNNSATEEDIARLNGRLQPDFEPSRDEFFIYLATINDVADAINEKALSRLPGQTWRREGSVKGKFERSSMPAPEILNLKIGAQVMMVNNDQLGRWVNGTIGRVAGFEPSDGDQPEAVIVELDNGETAEIFPNKWDLFQYKIENGQIGSETVGSFVQYPIRVAFAITIHKSQGKTFDKVVLDLERGTFAHGQLYVALSRCTSFEGLVLKKPVKKSHIRMDWNVVKFITNFQYRKASSMLPTDEKIRIIEKAIKNQSVLKIVYLKGRDEKSERMIKPLAIGEMEYLGYNFLGLKAVCLARKAERTFNVEKILEMDFEVSDQAYP